MKLKRIVGSIFIAGLSLTASSSWAEEALPGAERHRWRAQLSQHHSLATAPDVGAQAMGFRYHFSGMKCVEGAGNCDMAY